MRFDDTVKVVEFIDERPDVVEECSTSVIGEDDDYYEDANDLNGSRVQGYCVPSPTSPSANIPTTMNDSSIRVDRWCYGVVVDGGTRTSRTTDDVPPMLPLRHRGSYNNKLVLEIISGAISIVGQTAAAR